MGPRPGPKIWGDLEQGRDQKFDGTGTGTKDLEQLWSATVIDALAMFFFSILNCNNTVKSSLN